MAITSASVNDDVVRTAAVALGAPYKPALDVIVAYQPAGSVRMRLQLPPGDGIRGASSHGLHERVQVGVGEQSTAK